MGWEEGGGRGAPPCGECPAGRATGPRAGARRVPCPSPAQACLGVPVHTQRALLVFRGSRRAAGSMHPLPQSLPHPALDAGTGRAACWSPMHHSARPGMQAAAMPMQPGITTFPQPPPRQYSPPLEARKVCGEKRRGGNTVGGGVRGTDGRSVRERKRGRQGEDPGGCPAGRQDEVGTGRPQAGGGSRERGEPGPQAPSHLLQRTRQQALGLWLVSGFGECLPTA